MLDARFVFLALALNTLGAALYLKETLRGEVRPHPVSWLLWTLAPSIAFAAQLVEGVGLPSLLTLAVAINPIAVLVVLVKSSKSRWRVSAADVAYGALSFTGLVLWIIYKNAMFAIWLSIATDALAAIPTYRKAIAHPRSEAWLQYALLAVSSALVLMTIDQWNAAGSLFAVYLVLLGLSLTIIVLIGQSRIVAATRRSERGIATRAT